MKKLFLLAALSVFSLSIGQTMNSSGSVSPPRGTTFPLGIDVGQVFKLPATSTELDLPNIAQVGRLRFNPTTNQVEVRDNSGWVPVASSPSPVSANQSGIVNNVPLQELGGVDKLLNGIRIGRGNNNFDSNLTFGTNALSKNTSGTYNTAIGATALFENTSGNNNLAVGGTSLFNNTTGTYNTGIGVGALYTNNTGGRNVGIGGGALYYNTTGVNNVAIGVAAMQNNTTSSRNVAIGDAALFNNTSANTTFQGNVAIGNQSLRDGTVVNNNTAIGNYSGYFTSGGTDNTFVGFASGYRVTGGGNTVIGAHSRTSGFGINTGERNVLIQPSISKNAILAGSRNVVIGNVSDSEIGSNLNDQIIIATGGTGIATPPETTYGAVAFKRASDGTTTLPSQTVALYNADTTGKAAVTKEVLNAQFGINNASAVMDTATLNIVPPDASVGYHLYQHNATGGPLMYVKITENGASGDVWIRFAGRLP